MSKNYYIHNKPVSQEEFERTKKKIFENHDLFQKALFVFANLSHISTLKENRNLHSENCIGDDLQNCQNCFMCFEAVNTKDCRYCTTAYENKNCYDTTIYNPGSEWTLEGICGGVNLHSSGYNYACIDMRDGWYTWGCMNSKNIFGCIALHSHEHHCILNKSYSTQEYETLCGKIIDHMRSTGEWGEFFPHELSPFGYNETVANEYFPMTEEEVKGMPRFEEWRFREPPSGRGNSNIAGTQGDLGKNKSSALSTSSGHLLQKGGLGWNWHTEDIKPFEGTAYIPLPIREYDERVVGFATAQQNIDAVLAGTILCEITKKPFKIIKQELLFYIENSIPIPTKHPDQRHKERMDLRNPRTLYERTCSECGKDIMTTYAPAVRGSVIDSEVAQTRGEEPSGSGRERLEKVVCEECYRRLVY